MTLPQSIFQTGDMVYFGLVVNNPASTIDMITFNQIVVYDVATQKQTTTLYKVSAPGVEPTDSTNTFDPNVLFNITSEVRGPNPVPPGTDAELDFEFKLLRSAIDALFSVSSVSSATMQKDLMVEVTIDIWYHGNDNSRRRTFIASTSHSGPLPSVEHTQIAFYDVDNTDIEQQPAVNEDIEETGNMFSAAAPSSSSSLVFAFVVASAIFAALI